MRLVLPILVLALCACASMPVARPRAGEVVVTKTKRPDCEPVRALIVGEAVAGKSDDAIVGAIVGLRNEALEVGATHVVLLRSSVESAWSIGSWAIGSSLRARYEGRAEWCPGMGVPRPTN